MGFTNFPFGGFTTKKIFLIAIKYSKAHLKIMSLSQNTNSVLSLERKLCCSLSSDGAARPKILQMIFQECYINMRWVTFIQPV